MTSLLRLVVSFNAFAYPRVIYITTRLVRDKNDKSHFRVTVDLAFDSNQQISHGIWTF